MTIKTDRQKIIEAIKSIDVDDFSIEHENPMAIKWFRFGAYSALEIISRAIDEINEEIVS